VAVSNRTASVINRAPGRSPRPTDGQRTAGQRLATHPPHPTISTTPRPTRARGVWTDEYLKQNKTHPPRFVWWPRPRTVEPRFWPVPDVALVHISSVKEKGRPSSPARKLVPACQPPRLTRQWSSPPTRLLRGRAQGRHGLTYEAKPWRRSRPEREQCVSCLPISFLPRKPISQLSRPVRR